MNYLIIRNPETGATSAVRDEETIKRLYPDHEVVGYEDGTPFVPGAADKAAATEELAKAGVTVDSLVTPPTNPAKDEEETGGELSGFLDAAELGRLTRAQLDDLGVSLGVTDAADKAVYPNIPTLIEKLVTIPVTVPTDEDDD